MRLIYYKDEQLGANFGDDLNEDIFRHYLPGFFDDSDELHFLGIGSILGLSFAKARAKKVVFSSGYAYGTIPNLDDSYEFHCVRGPKTAEILGLDPKLAIADGAYLLRGMPFEPVEKEFDCSIMLHWSNLKKYDWKPLCEAAGLNFIDPAAGTQEILGQLRKSKLVLAEAMHAAIAADALRVPWLPICCYKGVNTFKWLDFTLGMEIPYEPERVTSLYDKNNYVSKMIREKTKGRFSLNGAAGKAAFSGYEIFIKKSHESKAEAMLRDLAKREGINSSISLIDGKFEQLLSTLKQVQVTYS